MWRGKSAAIAGGHVWKTLVRSLKFYVLLVVAASLFLAACELGLRSAFPDEIPSTADYEMLEPDDVLGYRLAAVARRSVRANTR